MVVRLSTHVSVCKIQLHPPFSSLSHINTYVQRQETWFLKVNMSCLHFQEVSRDINISKHAKNYVENFWEYFSIWRERPLPTPTEVLVLVSYWQKYTSEITPLETNMHRRFKMRLHITYVTQAMILFAYKYTTKGTLSMCWSKRRDFYFSLEIERKTIQF